MRIDALPTGATTMLQIIILMTLLAAGFAAWLWWQNRRLSAPARERVRTGS